MSGTETATATSAPRLRPLRPSDAPDIAALANDEDVARMTTRLPHPYALGDAEQFLEALLGGASDERAWAIETGDPAEAALAGVAGWKSAEAGAAGDVGYWLGRAYWGRGLASAAGAALVARAFAAPEMAVLRACVFQDNPASARVLKKLGFSDRGACAGWSEARGRTDPTWLYELTRADWETRRAAGVSGGAG